MSFSATVEPAGNATGVEVPAGLARGYVMQAGWDPRESGESMRFMVLRPLRIQAWREADELPGRTLMRGGAWIP